MTFCFGRVFRILEIFLLIRQISLATTQGHIPDIERRFTGLQDGQLHLSNGPRPANLQNMLTPDSHVDLPGEHGNRSPHPVIHRHQHSNAHVDLPGQHGNSSPHPSVHRHSTSHVDISGQHSNESPPMFHGQHRSHIDFPGEHGNDSPFPAVHRQSGSHVDLPGHHGNDSPLPDIHRDKHLSDHQVHSAELSGARRQSFVDPVSGVPVVISTTGSNSASIPNDHRLASNRPQFHSRSVGATGGNRPLDLHRMIHEPISGPRIAPPVMPMSEGVPFPVQRDFGRPFDGPLLPVHLHRPLLFVPPVFRGMGRYHGLRHPRPVRRLSPRFPPPPPPSPPRRIGLREIIAGAIVSLLGNISRQ